MKKKTSLRLIVIVYAGIMAASTLLVPVKAYIGSGTAEDPDGHREQGYYPIWELGKHAQALENTGKKKVDKTVENTGKKTVMIISLNLFAWIMQYLFVTLLFSFYYYRTYRYYKEIENF